MSRPDTALDAPDTALDAIALPRERTNRRTTLRTALLPASPAATEPNTCIATSADHHYWFILVFVADI